MLSGLNKFSVPDMEDKRALKEIQKEDMVKTSIMLPKALKNRFKAKVSVDSRFNTMSDAHISFIREYLGE